MLEPFLCCAQTKLSPALYETIQPEGADYTRRVPVLLDGSMSPAVITTTSFQVGAAVLGVPVKPTIKEVRQDGTVVKTLKRANLWEVQTPQVLLRPSQCM